MVSRGPTKPDGYTGRVKTTDRKRGILTKKDREYLLGEYQPEGQDERNTRYRIRQRLKEALADIELISWELSEQELKQVIDSSNDMLGERGIWSLLSLAYQIQLLIGSEPHIAGRESFADRNEYFERSIEMALLRTLTYRRNEELVDNEDELNPVDYEVNAQISVEENVHDTTDIFEKLKDGSATEEEFEIWVEYGDPETLREYKEKTDKPLKYQSSSVDTQVSVDLSLGNMERYDDEDKDE